MDSEKVVNEICIGPGVHVAVERHELINYTAARAQQVKALATIVADDEFDMYNMDTRDGVRQLLASLSHEVSQLLPQIGASLF